MVLPEFSRLVDVPRVAGRSMKHAISASAEERAELAARFGLIAIDYMQSSVDLELLAGGIVRLSASLTANVVQTCVVTLEAVPATIDETFILLYGSIEQAGEVVINGETDIVEPLEGSRIDIGEAVAQQLSLALDPFPRAPQTDRP